MKTPDLEKLIAQATPLPPLGVYKGASGLLYLKDARGYYVCGFTGAGTDITSQWAEYAMNSILPTSRRCDELSGLLMQCIPYLVESLQRSNESLKGADPQSQFYGEDIVTPPLLTKIKTLLSQIESENSISR